MSTMPVGADDGDTEALGISDGFSLAVVDGKSDGEAVGLGVGHRPQSPPRSRIS